MFCDQCGEKNHEGSKYCVECGNVLNVNTDIEYEIKGNNLPFVTIKMNVGDRIIAESGSMSWRTNNIKVETTSNERIEKVFSRMLTSESLFQNIYTSLSDNEKITFSSSFPGAILPIDIQPGKEIICQKTAFLAGTHGVNLDVHINKRVGVGLFNGEGFIMQRISGTGKVFIEVDGSIDEIILSEDEKIVISSGHLVMMDSTCNIDVETINGLKNIFFGGEGLFNTIITGPGRVIVQSMPINKTAHEIYRYLPKPPPSSNNN